MFPGTHAKHDPERAAIIVAETGETMSYRRLDDDSAALARVLHDAGLRPGDVVALLSDNAPEALVVLWATQRSGLYVTAINHHLTAPEAAYIVGDSGARVLIASAALADLATAVVAEGGGPDLLMAFGGEIDGFLSYESAIAGAGPRLSAQPCGAVMLYSSGTTGFPKGIRPDLPSRNVDEPGDPVVAIARGLFGITSSDVYLSSAPIYHAAPLRWCGVVHALGGTVVLAKKFDAVETLDHVERYRITATQMVPTMFVRMLKLDEEIRTSHDMSSLRVVIHAAAPCPVDVKLAMIAWLGPVIYEYYSATEVHGMTVIDTEQWLTHRGSVGQSVLGTLHICDDDGHELPVGSIGTVYFERDTVPFIYHNAPEKTAEAQHPAHPLWTTVGDLGYVDDEGYLYLTDRKSFMIISGGVNIYPQEIENALAMHPAVYDVAVIGVPDPEMGEQVKAIVQLNPGLPASDELAADLIKYTRERIAHYKAPRSVDFVDRLPRTPTGKLVKGKLRERYTTSAAR
ncbi:acyl-CoA synthetase [Mycolicibacterium moriokaense]|uniref:Long-chain-fatty-acid--CoA ligase FadD13 n=1 Tax=Mycolicibacterium moriokaense TaxID=39691 RepID=A0AAD1H8V0_9MYCO|nr:AMP-binding protein [Mycolicibacterium moriokaense]MCV7037609.1 AMP-binding protein [Mycolicibacterium moriokaense]ORB23663.1 acyl-CoA synthetase [Mycolicibacterium moriokaense]BBW99452.1 putative acyl-CoA ligase [Mycolicibacterium moriokaense]